MCLDEHDLHKRGSYMVWEINLGVCPHLEIDNIDNIMLINDFYIYGDLSFYVIPLLFYDVMNDITIIP